MAVYVSSDWHGADWAWEKVKEFLKPEDRLYFLGDAIDRQGEDGGWGMMKEMLADDRVIYLLGNHEDMLLNALRSHEETLCVYNGGFNTLNAARIDPEVEKILEKIAVLPLWTAYTRPNGEIIFMSHSGSTDKNRHDLLWDRSEYINRVNWSHYDFIIHGHTSKDYLYDDLLEVADFCQEKALKPVPYEEGAYWYRDFRCDVDCGTVDSGEVVLLDLDTFNEHIFFKEPLEQEVSSL